MPAKFSFDGKDLSVNGYIQIFFDGRNGTLRDRGAKSTRPSFLDGNAKTICKSAGYAEIADGWSNGKYCDGKGDDRSSLRCLISGLRCFGSEETIAECQMDKIVDPTKPPPPAPTTTVAPTTQPEPQTTAQPQTTAKPQPGTTTQPQPQTTAAPTKAHPETTKHPITVKPTKPKPQTTAKPQPTAKPQTTAKSPEYELVPLTDWDHKEDVAIKCNF